MQKRFYNTFLIALITAVLITSVMYWGITAGLLRVNRDFQSKLNYLVRGTEHYDAVFIGASRVFDGINPLLFDSITGINSFNAGMEGARIAEISVFLNKYIESHGAPQFLFLSIENDELATDIVWDFPRFFPFVTDSNVLSLYKYQPAFLYARYLPPIALSYYDDSRKTLGVEGFIGNPERYAYAFTKGYNALKENSIKTIEPAVNENYRYTSDGLKILKGICELCKKKGISFIFVLPPRLIDDKLVGANLPASFKVVSDIANLYNIPVYDISHKKEFTDPKLSYDGFHLVAKGADLYTAMLAKKFNERSK
jgi:hypothetical protein